MKNVFIFLLLGFLLFFAFTGVGTAEEAGGKSKVYRIFDLSFLRLAPTTSHSVFGLTSSTRVPDFVNVTSGPPYENSEFNKALIDNINNAIGRTAKDDSPTVDFLPDGRIIVFCRKKDLGKVAKIVNALRPRKQVYDARMILLSGKNVKDNGFGESSYSDNKTAVETAIGNGYVPVFDTVTSLNPGRKTFIEDTREKAFIAEYEGLIATFAKILDPVIKQIAAGTGISVTLREKKEGVCLDLDLQYGVLKEIKSKHTQGYLLEEPIYEKHQARKKISFIDNTVKCLRFSCAEVQYLLLISVK